MKKICQEFFFVGLVVNSAHIAERYLLNLGGRPPPSFPNYFYGIRGSPGGDSSWMEVSGVIMDSGTKLSHSLSLSVHF